MPRPVKWRKVCCLPERNRFGPLDSLPKVDGIINMTVDEYETIRLIDFEGRTQEECAIQMNVARTTVQRIYFGARKKVAELIVNGKVLLIKGGEYQICDGKADFCSCGGCRRHRFNKEHFNDTETDCSFKTI